MMALLQEYTPDIEKLSIDECFLDFTPIQHLYESPVAAATIIKEDIKARFGFTVNIGIAENKLLAKMASDFQKPDRIHTLFRHEIQAKMWPLPVDELYMVGRSSATRLKSLGIRTIGELANTDKSYLQSEFKSHGKLMWEYANGIGDDTVHPEVRERKGVGNSVTLGADITDKDAAYKVLLRLSETVSARLRKAEQIASSVTVEIKYSSFASFSHQAAFFTPSNTTDALYTLACQLFDELWNGSPIRLLGIRTTKLLSKDTPLQLSIFDYNMTQVSDTPATIQKNPKLERLDAAVDSIRGKYGKDSIVRGSFLSSSEIK